MKTFLIFVICSVFTLAAAAQTDATGKAQMTSTEFNRFLQNAKTREFQYYAREDVESMKDEIISTSNYFSTAQVRRVLSSMEKDSGKFAMARLLYNKVTDPGNYAQLSDLFSLSNYKDEFLAWYKGSEKTYLKAPVIL